MSSASPHSGACRATEKPRVLVVDDSPSVLFVLGRTLEAMGFEVDAVATLAGALQLLGRTAYRAVLTDLRLDGDERTLGLEVLATCRRLHPATDVIVLTGFGNPKVMEKAFQLGARFYFEKPVALERLKVALREVQA